MKTAIAGILFIATASFAQCQLVRLASVDPRGSGRIVVGPMAPLQNDKAIGNSREDEIANSIGPAPHPVLVAQEIAPLQDAQNSNDSPIPIPKETPEEAAERMSHRASLANERISVSAPEGDVPLGSPVDIDVKFAPGQIADMHVAQFKPHGKVRGGIDWSQDAFKIVREEGQTKTIEVVPMQLGSINLEIGAAYADNALAQQTIKLNVVPSSKGLKKFCLDRWSNAKGWGFAALVLGDEEKDRQLWLQPVLTYKDVKFPILLDDSTQIKLSVEQDEDDPVLRVDPNGLVHGLREGRAVIVGDFDGAIDRVQVTVYSKEDAPAGYEVITH
jgi:hypothetical protein